MAERIHLVRRGEVHNPKRLVNGSLPGFPLNARGWIRPSRRRPCCPPAPSPRCSSPLERTLQTAEVIGARLGGAVVTLRRGVPRVEGAVGEPVG